MKDLTLKEQITKIKAVYPNAKLKIDKVINDGKFLAWRKGNKIDFALIPECR